MEEKFATVGKEGELGNVIAVAMEVRSALYMKCRNRYNSAIHPRPIRGYKHLPQFRLRVLADVLTLVIHHLRGVETAISLLRLSTVDHVKCSLPHYIHTSPRTVFPTHRICYPILRCCS